MPMSVNNSPRPPVSGFARQPETLPSEFEIDKVVIGRGDSVWKIIKRELGEGATDPDIQNRLNQYVEANKDRFADLNQVIPGDELIRPPLPKKEDDKGWVDAAEEGRRAQAPTTEDTAAAEAQMQKAREAEAAQRQTDLKSLSDGLVTLADKATEGNGSNAPLTDSQKSDIADLAKGLFSRAKTLGVEEEARQSAPGKTLQGIIDQVDLSKATKGIEALAKEVVDTQNGQRAALTDPQADDIARRAVPLLETAKQLASPEYLGSDDVKRLQDIVKGATTRSDAAQARIDANRQAFRKSEIEALNAAAAAEARAKADAPAPAAARPAPGPEVQKGPPADVANRQALARLAADVEIYAAKYGKISPADLKDDEKEAIQKLVDKASLRKIGGDSLKVLQSKLVKPAAPAAEAEAAEEDTSPPTPII